MDPPDIQQGGKVKRKYISSRPPLIISEEENRDEHYRELLSNTVADAAGLMDGVLGPSHEKPALMEKSLLSEAYWSTQYEPPVTVKSNPSVNPTAIPRKKKSTKISAPGKKQKGAKKNSDSVLGDWKPLRRLATKVNRKEGEKFQSQPSSEELSKTDVTDETVITTLATRLAKVERLVRKLNGELVKKDREIQSLRRELSLVKALDKNDNNNNESAENVRKSLNSSLEGSLNRENQRLRREINAMHGFLNDYGLEWVGEAENNSDGSVGEEDEANIHIPSTAGLPQPEEEDVNVDMGLLLRRIRELNIVAGEGTTKFEQQKDGRTHKLRPPDSVPITFYRNGLLLNQGPFRYYSDISTRAFVADILDGYFPYELRGQYPDGMCFDAIDKSTELFVGEAEVPVVFPGDGQVLGGQKSELPAVSGIVGGRPREKEGGLRIVGLSNMDEQRPVGKEEFLKRLPPTVIRNGKTISIRDEIAHTLEGADSEPRVVSLTSPKTSPAKESLHYSTEQESIEQTTLQIKSIDQNQVFVLVLPVTSTIGDILRRLDSNRGSVNIPENFELRTAFPPKAYYDKNQTLESAGLVPNATLILRPIS